MSEDKDVKDDSTNYGLNAISKFVSYLEKKGYIPIWEWRKRNMFTAQEVKLQLEAQSRCHERIQEIEDAKVKIITSLALEQTNIRVSEVSKMITNPAITEKDIKEHLDLTARAAASICNEAIQAQYSKERITLYAAEEIAKNSSEQVNEEEPSETWFTRFMKYAGEVRDEDARMLWGKILAGEIKKPGSISLRTIEVLRNLDQKDAQLFVQLAPYVLNSRYLPDKVLKILNIGVFCITDLASTGLVITSLNKIYEGKIVAANRWYVAQEKDELNYENKTYSMPAVFLTEAGSEIYKLIPLSKQESFRGMELFSSYITELFQKDFMIDELPENFWDNTLNS